MTPEIRPCPLGPPGHVARRGPGGGRTKWVEVQDRLVARVGVLFRGPSRPLTTCSAQLAKKSDWSPVSHLPGTSYTESVELECPRIFGGVFTGVTGTGRDSTEKLEARPARGRVGFLGEHGMSKTEEDFS